MSIIENHLEYPVKISKLDINMINIKVRNLILLNINFKHKLIKGHKLVKVHTVHYW